MPHSIRASFLPWTPLPKLSIDDIPLRDHLPSYGDESRALRFEVESETTSLKFSFFLYIFQYILLLADLLQSFPAWALGLRVIYFAIFFGTEWAIGWFMQGNPVIRSQLFLDQAFFAIVASLGHIILRTFPCIPLSYPNHLGLDDVPVVGPYISQCSLMPDRIRILNWLSCATLLILFSYAFLTYLWLLYRTSSQLTQPLEGYYNRIYLSNRNSWTRRQISRLFTWINRPGPMRHASVVPYPRALFMSSGTHAIIDERYCERPVVHQKPGPQSTAIRFLLEAAIQPEWLTTCLHLSPYLLSVANILQTEPAASLSMRIAYLLLFIYFQAFIILRCSGNPIINSTGFFRTAFFALGGATGHLALSTVGCLSFVRNAEEREMGNGGSPISSSMENALKGYQCTVRSNIQMVYDWVSFVVTASMFAYVSFTYTRLIWRRKCEIGSVLREYCESAYPEKEEK